MGTLARFVASGVAAWLGVALLVLLLPRGRLPGLLRTRAGAALAGAGAVGLSAALFWAGLRVAGVAGFSAGSALALAGACAAVGAAAGLLARGVVHQEEVAAGDPDGSWWGRLLFRLGRRLARPSRRRERRRARLRARPFPSAWAAVLERNLPLYRRLSAEDRARLHGHVLVFLDEKRFEGCGGVEMTDEIRVTVAGQACLLLLRLEEPHYYPRLRSILVYPEAFVSANARAPAHGELAPGPVTALGESWGHGTVVLAWNAVLRGAQALDDGRNLVFHEFAHQLDQEDGEGDGTPHLPSYPAFLVWARVMREHYETLRRDTARGRRSVLDDYGATHPTEFFAVATEAFFEKPVQLRRKHPELYEELRAYYGVDPVEWVGGTLPVPAAGT